MIDVRINPNLETSESEKKVWLNEKLADTDYELLAETNGGLQAVVREWSFTWVDIVRFKNESDAMAFKLRFGL